MFTILSSAKRSGLSKKDRPSRPMSVILSSLEQQQPPSSLQRNHSLRVKNEKLEGMLITDIFSIVYTYNVLVYYLRVGETLVL